jgi:surface antigen
VVSSMDKGPLIAFFAFVLALAGCTSREPVPMAAPTPSQPPMCGDTLDVFNGVPVHHNGGIHSCDRRRHWSPDGYSYGIRWQCVEFVRRYYKDRLGHAMPERYGNAVDYFRAGIPHGGMNYERGLVQYRNGEREKPRPDDLVVFPRRSKGLGHVAIVARVTEDTVTVVQQNAETVYKDLALVRNGDRWTVEGGCAGFLRLPATRAAVSPLAPEQASVQARRTLEAGAGQPAPE